MFSTILHARSIPAELIHAKHLILHQLESPSKCSPVYAIAFLACTLSMAEKVVVIMTLRDCDKSHEHLVTFSTYTLNRACIADSIEVCLVYIRKDLDPSFLVSIKLSTRSAGVGSFAGTGSDCMELRLPLSPTSHRRGAVSPVP